MNRRQFLKRGVMAAVAITAAPAALLAAEHGFTMMDLPSNGKPMYPTLALEDYYSIQWPVTARSFKFGTYIGDGTMEHIAHFDATGTAWVPVELAPIKDSLTYKYVPVSP